MAAFPLNASSNRCLCGRSSSMFGPRAKPAIRPEPPRSCGQFRLRKAEFSKPDHRLRRAKGQRPRQKVARQVRSVCTTSEIKSIGPLPEARATAFSLHHEPVGAEKTYLYDHAVAGPHPPAAVRESHPVRLAGDGRAALSQFPYLLHLRNFQLHPSLRIDQGRLRLLIIERGSLIRIQDAVTEANHLARLRVPDLERVNPPDAFVVHL